MHIYHFTIIREMKRAKYATVLNYGTGQKYGQKRSARSLISFPIFRYDYFNNEHQSQHEFFFGHQ